MAQRPTADYPIDANTTSGTDLSLILNRFQSALESGNSGSSRPAYITAGGLWVKEGDPMELYLYDGTTDQLLYDTSNGINVTEGLWTLVDSNDEAGEIQRPSDVLIDGNLTVTGDLVDADGNPISIIEPATEQGVIATWDDATKQWTPEGAVVVGANGNVGIGSDAPARPLHIESSSYAQVMFRSTADYTTDYAASPGVIFQGKGSTGGNRQFGAIHGVARDDNSGDIVFETRNAGSSDERVRIDSKGRVGIGGQAGTRTIDEAKALAKTKLTEWKAEVKKRTAEQPEASTQDITLEVTDGDFGVMPTEDTLAEFLQSRAIGGGNAKLQVAGDGYFSGTVYANGSPLTRVTDIVETFRTLKAAVSDETTVEGIKEALTNSLGGLIEKFEAMQSAATQEIES